MKILVAGAGGVVGRHLIPLLVAAGNEVAGTTRRADRAPLLESLGTRPVTVDVLDRAAVLDLLAAERADAVIHQLTDLSARDLVANSRLRREGTRHLVDAALAAGVRRLIAQSIAWIYVPGEGPATELAPLDHDAPPPRGDTVAGVQALETAVGEMPEGIILRYGLFYGSGTWYSRDGLFGDSVRRGEVPATDGVTSFLHVEDAARAAVAALSWPPGVYNIVDDEPAPGTAWLPLFAECVGAPPPPYQPGSGRGERGASNALARRECGWQPRYPTWREGFRTGPG